MTAAFVEAAVMDWLRDLAGDVDAARDAAVRADARRVSLHSEGERLAREVQRVEDALQRLVVQQAQSAGVPDVVFAAARGELAEKHRGLMEALELVQREGRRAVADPGAVAVGLLESWDRLPVAGRRTVLADLIAQVVVTTGRPRAVVEVEPAWKA